MALSPKKNSSLASLCHPHRCKVNKFSVNLANSLQKEVTNKNSKQVFLTTLAA